MSKVYAKLIVTTTINIIAATRHIIPSTRVAELIMDWVIDNAEGDAREFWETLDSRFLAVEASILAPELTKATVSFVHIHDPDDVYSFLISTSDTGTLELENRQAGKL